MEINKVHILPGQNVNPNNVYTIEPKGYTSGNGLHWAFETLEQVPCVGQCQVSPLRRDGSLCIGA
jgi:hypothetical protein